MWIASQHGFFSIVLKGEDLFFIRALVRQDLVNLIEWNGLALEIKDWPQANYRYRILVDLETLLEIMVQLSVAIDYPNFKGSVYRREDQADKLGAYQRIWEIMAKLPSGEAGHDVFC
jgi:hypothetical protein